MKPSLADLGAVRSDLHRRPPSWFRGIVATGLGRRAANGGLLDELALHVVVGEKRPNRGIRLAERIPSTLDGLPVDVVGQLPPSPVTTPTSSPSPSSISEFGCGDDVAGDHGENGTVGCVGISYEGQPVLITTNHVVQYQDRAFSWQQSNHPTIGRGNYGVLELPGQQLYGSAAAHPEELFQVEATRIDPAPGLTLFGGLPGNTSFSVQATTELRAWLQGAAVVSYGAKTGDWRSGQVLTLFPRRPDAALTGMCLIQETSQQVSSPGDSGSLWAANTDQGFVAVGLHWGVVWVDSNSPRYTFVTELQAALAWLRVRDLVGDANWTGTT
jgi:hypothetical protein